VTELRVENLCVPASELGPENPLPEFRSPQEDREVRVDPAVPEEDRRYFGWRSGYRVMPYRLQDSYGASLAEAELVCLVLENEFLRATVLPSLGGRLISLYHKEAERELFEHNPIIRFGNLALRKAWFSGGVEWNTSQPGHHYLTCSPVFAARLKGSRGEPALRLYEWDRVKCFPWQVDLHLPPGSRELYARVRLVNPHDHEIPMYWWTNIAVPETPETRALAPANQAIRADLKLGFTVIDFAEDADVDHSYATRIAGSKDIFFRVPPEQWPWIAALDGEGRGLFQTSTPRLRGRKLFAWGNHQGGRRWQEFLGGPGQAYIEIQAGLTRTQAETVPMPGRTEWSWTEAFGLLQADADAVHDTDWERAWPAAENALREVITPERIAEVDRELAQVTAGTPEEILCRGSGWAALERRRLAERGLEDRIPPELIFDAESMGPDQTPWVRLLEDGALPETDPGEDPGQWMIQDDWAREIETALEAGRGDHWLSWLHLGLARAEALDPEGAVDAWRTSLDRRRSGWALRNIAAFARRRGDAEEAQLLLKDAWEIGPRISPLARECARTSFECGDHSGVREFVAGLSSELADDDRLVVLDARAALELGDFDAVERALQREFAHVREGSSPITDLWFEMHARRLALEEGVEVSDEHRRRAHREFPAPRNIDFRQKA
jgi:hypothetical protein